MSQRAWRKTMTVLNLSFIEIKYLGVNSYRVVGFSQHF